MYSVLGSLKDTPANWGLHRVELELGRKTVLAKYFSDERERG